MTVTEKMIDGKIVSLAVLVSSVDGCKYCMFKNECTNPPVNRVMPCFSIDRKGRDSVYYKLLKK